MKHPEMCILNYKIFMKLMNFIGNALNLKNKSDMLQSRKKNSLFLYRGCSKIEMMEENYEIR